MSAMPNATLERDLAQKLVTNMENMTAGLADIKKQAEEQAAKLKKVDGLEADVQKIVKAYDDMKTRFDSVSRMIRRSAASALGMPGADEDPELERFSLLRTMVAVRTGNWDEAKFEKGKIEEWKSNIQRAAHTAEIGSRVGVFIPDFTFAEVIAAVYARSAFVNLDGAGEGTTLVTVINGVPAPSGSISKVQGGVISYWLGEEDKVAESNMEAGDLNFNLKILANMVRITQRMRDYGGMGWENFLRNDMIRSMIQKLDWTIAYGTGTANCPRGIVNTNGVKLYSAKSKAVVTAAPGTNDGADASFDDLDEMMGVLEDANLPIDDSSAFVFHPRFKRRIKRLKVDSYSGQTTNQMYLMGLPRLPDNRLAEIIGRFQTSTQIPVNRNPGQSVGWTDGSSNAQKCTDVFYGTWSDLVLVRGVGINIDDDAGKGKGFASGHMYVKLHGYFDTMFRRPEAIVVMPDAKVQN